VGLHHYSHIDYHSLFHWSAPFLEFSSPLSENLLIGLAAVITLAIGAQWVAWRFRVPSILLLLLCGFLAGPVTGLLDVDGLMGPLLPPFVSVAVGIILFEGGLSLRLSELQSVGHAVRNLITIGVLVTFALGAVAAHFVAGFGIELSLIVGSVLTVTGPTVVIPLLKHIRPTGRVSAIAKWEGITIDPIGAILAVLVLEGVLLYHESVPPGVHITAAGGAILVEDARRLFETIFIGLGAGVAGALLLVQILRRRLLPDYLRNAVALTLVVLVFSLSDILRHESGLLATTVMGIALANQRLVSVKRISEFKEDLGVLLIGSLFILLSARLDLQAMESIGIPAALFLLVLMFVVRPAAVFASMAGRRYTTRERVFLSWLAPRGIVAAAVASLFSFRLEPIFGEEAARLVPTVFLVIVGTVAVYGLTIGPLARKLGLAEPDPQGVLFVGAQKWIRELALALHRAGIRVLLADANPTNVDAARRVQLPAVRADILSETVIEELELGGIGRLLAVTRNDEVNALAALHFAEIFETSEIYQLVSDAPSGRERIPEHLRGRLLFTIDATYDHLRGRIGAGSTVITVRAQETTRARLMLRDLGESAVPMFVVRTDQKLDVITIDEEVEMASGDRLIVLVEDDFVPEIPPPDPSDEDQQEDENAEMPRTGS
jgi:NhaP-type Na+/H+ or K+/H+ antiporter/Trk K+ transport system NAD-binding subunit